MYSAIHEKRPLEAGMVISIETVIWNKMSTSSNLKTRFPLPTTAGRPSGMWVATGLWVEAEADAPLTHNLCEGQPVVKSQNKHKQFV